MHCISNHMFTLRVQSRMVHMFRCNFLGFDTFWNLSATCGQDPGSSEVMGDPQSSPCWTQRFTSRSNRWMISEERKNHGFLAANEALLWRFGASHPSKCSEKLHNCAHLSRNFQQLQLGGQGEGNNISSGRIFDFFLTKSWVQRLGQGWQCENHSHFSS